MENRPRSLENLELMIFMNAFQGAYRGKRVLVTGHTGFKGSWLCEWLLGLGAEVAGYSVDVPSNPSHFEILKLSERLTHRMGDVRNAASLTQFIQEFKPEIVFHLAAQALVRKSYDHPADTFETNLMGTVRVLDAIRSVTSVKAAVFITSDKCYENVEWEYGYRETDRLGGQDPYSASKACAEIAFSSYARSFFASPDSARIASARAGNVIGGGDWAVDRIVPDCVRAWSAGKDVSIRNPSSTRPWQHVLEPLSGYLMLGAALLKSKEEVRNESFNFGPPADVTQSVDQLIREVQKTWKNANWKQEGPAPSAKKEAGLLKLNCDKAWHRLSWEPTLKFEESIRMTAEWYLAAQKDPALAAEITRTQIGEYARFATERKRAWV